MIYFTDKAYTIIRELGVLACPSETCTFVKQDSRRLKEHVEKQHGWKHVSISAPLISTSHSVSSQSAEDNSMDTASLNGAADRLSQFPCPSIRSHPYRKATIPASSRRSVNVVNDKVLTISSALSQSALVDASMTSLGAETNAKEAYIHITETQICQLDNSILPCVTAQAIILDKSLSYLVSTSLLERYSLHIHNHFKTLHCMICLSAHTPFSMSKHLESHSMGMDKAAQAQLTIIAAEHQLIEDYSVINPLPEGPPIEGLVVIQEGLSCTACIYCTVSDKTFKNHWYSQHSGPAKNASKRVAVQNFFPSIYNFFSVDPSLAKQCTVDPFSIYMTQYVPQFAKPPILSPPTHICEVPPLLQITGWHHHLEEYVTDRAKLRELYVLMKLPSLKNNGPLGRLRSIVWLYMHSIRAYARSAPLSVRCILKEWPRYIFYKLN